ncbi:hypothetical protein BLNAU_3216 [Blattamonas nauphoetae]|uniref:Uncharacterized protein n=1 Tax=Blattamonas nauphoetae TaxID=2049346 RepID=A0ABQ9YDG9_9EUKA|nr:hypothetical protein BLNAU_3216 [Blattamonas nauphoetae]
MEWRLCMMANVEFIVNIVFVIIPELLQLSNENAQWKTAQNLQQPSSPSTSFPYASGTVLILCPFLANFFDALESDSSFYHLHKLQKCCGEHHDGLFEVNAPALSPYSALFVLFDFGSRRLVTFVMITSDNPLTVTTMLVVGQLIRFLIDNNDDHNKILHETNKGM